MSTASTHRNSHSVPNECQLRGTCLILLHHASMPDSPQGRHTMSGCSFGLTRNFQEPLALSEQTEESHDRQNGSARHWVSTP